MALELLNGIDNEAYISGISFHQTMYTNIKDMYKISVKMFCYRHLYIINTCSFHPTFV